MAHYVVWLDHEQARFFRYSDKGLEKTHIKNHNHHNTHSQNHYQADKNHLQDFYKEVAGHLQDATAVFLVGPGLAKTEFQKLVEHHSHGTLGKAIVSVETMDKATDGEVENFAHKLFHKYNLFHA
jgi:stalled ribosome rescue protein Dom34